MIHVQPFLPVMLIIKTLAPLDRGYQLQPGSKIQFVVDPGAGAVPPEIHQGLFDAVYFGKPVGNKTNPIILSPMRRTQKKHEARECPKGESKDDTGRVMTR